MAISLPKGLENTDFYKAILTRTSNMSLLEGVAFDDLVVIKSGKGNRAELPFFWFDKPEYCMSGSFDVYVENNHYTIPSSALAWMIWLDYADESHGFAKRKYCFSNLLLLFGYLTGNKQRCLTNDNLDGFIETLLTCTPLSKGMKVRLGINCSGLTSVFYPNRIAAAVKEIGCHDLLASPITKSSMSRAFNDVCIRVGDLSFADYKEGGSFNFLTLDVGRHYIEHLNDTYIEHYCSAFAAAEVMRNKDLLLEGYATGKENTSLVRHALTATDAEKIPPKRKTLYKALLPKVIVFYNEVYKRISKRFKVLSEPSVVSITENLGLNLTEDSLLFVKSLVAMFLFDNSKSIESVIHDFSGLLEYKLTEPSFMTAVKFTTVVEKQMDSLELDDSAPLPTIQHMLRANIAGAAKGNHTAISKYDKVIGQHGWTLVMALLGWRESEYSFPNSAIQVFRNNDVIDQLRYPFRFQVKWTVPKTGGSTKLDREITLTSFILMKQLKELHASGSSLPMLYKCERVNGSAFNVENRANYACLEGWVGFVSSYKPFVELDELERLKQRAEVSKLHHVDQQNLSQVSINHSVQNKRLKFKEVRDKVRDDLPKLMASGLFAENHSKKGRGLIKEYVHGLMPIEKKAVWDKLLMPEQKEYLAGLVDSDFSVDNGTLNDIINTLRGECAYPTPHALRHMWAECVYRRYSGDVGWLIRTNFKHFGQQFFRRYLREKHMNRSEMVAKRRVISSILKSHLESLAQEEGREFAGKMDVFLRRSLKHTKVISPENIGDFLAKFAHLEIDDVRAHPWGWCLLKRRSKPLAKCAELGIPQPDKAGMDTCMGCPHNLVEQKHVPFIVLNTSNHVNVLNNTELPIMFKSESICLIKESVKTLKQLDKNSKTEQNKLFINAMESAIKTANKGAL